MGSPNAAYKQLMHNYIANSFKFDKALRDKYTDEFLYSLPIEELESIVKRINPENPIYNAMMAGVILEDWENDACIDEINAMCAILPDYLALFGVKMPDKVAFQDP